MPARHTVAFRRRHAVKPKDIDRAPGRASGFAEERLLSPLALALRGPGRKPAIE